MPISPSPLFDTSTCMETRETLVGPVGVATTTNAPTPTHEINADSQSPSARRPRRLENAPPIHTALHCKVIVRYALGSASNGNLRWDARNNSYQWAACIFLLHQQSISKACGAQVPPDLALLFTPTLPEHNIQPKILASQEEAIALRKSKLASLLLLWLTKSLEAIFFSTQTSPH